MVSMIDEVFKEVKILNKVQALVGTVGVAGVGTVGVAGVGTGGVEK